MSRCTRTDAHALGDCPDYIRENGGTYSTGASDGHIWNVATGECSPLCPAAGGHSGSLVYDDGGPSEFELRLRAEWAQLSESELRLMDGNR